MTNTRDQSTKPNTPDTGDQKKSDGSSGGVGGEDESSTEREGDDSHLHEDQKSRRLET